MLVRGQPITCYFIGTVALFARRRGCDISCSDDRLGARISDERWSIRLASPRAVRLDLGLAQPALIVGLEKIRRDRESGEILGRRLADPQHRLLRRLAVFATQIVGDGPLECGAKDWLPARGESEFRHQTVLIDGPWLPELR